MFLLRSPSAWWVLTHKPASTSRSEGKLVVAAVDETEAAGHGVTVWEGGGRVSVSAGLGALGR